MTAREVKWFLLLALLMAAAAGYLVGRILLLVFGAR
jgi:hypothetical protein